MMRTATEDRLFAEALAGAQDAAGGKRAFAIIGATFREALVARELLGILYRQDESVPAERVAELLDLLYARMTSWAADDE